MYKRIYDSDEIMVDYYNDGKPMIRVSQFEDGHWRDEHFVELPGEDEKIAHLEGIIVRLRNRADAAEHFICRMCDKCTWEDNGGVVVMQKSCCFFSPVKCGAFSLRSENVEPVVHAHWVDRYGGKYDNPIYDCSHCGGRALYEVNKRDVLGREYVEQALSDRCPYCGAHMAGEDKTDGSEN